MVNSRYVLLSKFGASRQERPLKTFTSYMSKPLVVSLVEYKIAIKL